MNKIDILVQMQKYDDVIAQKDKIIKDLPKQLQSLKDNVTDVKEELVNTDAERETNQKNQDKSRLLIQANNDKIAKYAHQQNDVKTNKEYKALNSEIDHLKKKNEEIEDTLLELMENESELKKSKRALNKKKKEADNELKSNEDKIKQKIKEVDEDIQNLRNKRNSIAKELPLQTLKRYVALIKNKNRKAIVHEVNKSCGGCGFSLRPQLLIELVKGKMHSCESCGRMIVSSTFFKTEE